MLDVLKGDESQAGRSDVIVRRLGGVRDEGEAIHRVVVEAFPDFAPGEEYVLFLSWNPEAGVYVVSGEESFEIKDGAVRANGKIQAAKKQNGKPAGEFIEDLRKLKKK